MSTPIDDLTAMIKVGSVKTVSEYGKNKLGCITPYVVIAPQAVSGNWQPYTVFAHFDIGKQRQLEDYVTFELPELLQREKDLAWKSKYKLTADGTTPSIQGISVDTATNTIYMSRQVYLPLISI